MTFRHLAASYCSWIWHQWSRFSAFFFTICVVAALTIGLAQTTHQYTLLYSRMQTSFQRQERERRLQPPPTTTTDAGRAEVVELLERILARLPEGRGGSISTAGPLSSSH